jgi:hypothetical protein
MAEKCGLVWDLNKLVGGAVGAAGGADIIGLYSVFKPMHKQSCDAHPRFRDLWQWALTEQLGFPATVTQDKAIPFFAANYWCARPAWMLRYINFFMNVQNLLDSGPPRIKEMLYADARYRGKVTRESLLAISGKPHYTHHPFIMERLPSFFFHREGASITRLAASTHASLVMPKQVHSAFLNLAK